MPLIEPVAQQPTPGPSQEEGIERLQNLIMTNINGIRPAIRERLGLPPLE